MAISTLKRLYLLLCFTAVWVMIVNGQNVQIVNQTQRIVTQKVKAFDFIDTAFHLEESAKVATLAGFSLNTGKPTIVELFSAFWNKANQLGANAFTVDSVLRTNDTIAVTLTAYFLREEEVTRNLELYPENMVYVIGDIDKKQSPKKIKLNEQKIVLEPMRYISYQNKAGEEAVISIGGLLGAKVWIAGEEGRLPKYLSVNGFGVGPGFGNTVSVSFNTGRIYPVELNFGQFLLTVLKEQN